MTFLQQQKAFVLPAIIYRISRFVMRKLAFFLRDVRKNAESARRQSYWRKLPKLAKYNDCVKARSLIGGRDKTDRDELKSRETHKNGNTIFFSWLSAYIYLSIPCLSQIYNVNLRWVRTYNDF